MVLKMRLVRSAIALTIALLVTVPVMVAKDDLPRSPLFKVIRDNKVGFMNRQGEIVIPPQFDSAEDFSEGVASVRIDGHWAFIDETGKVLFQLPQYTSVSNFYDGLASVEIQRDDELDPHAGYIDHSGTLVIPLRFRSRYSFSEGLAVAKDDNGKWGYIDKKGNWVIQPKFDEAGYFREGLAYVKVGLYEGVIAKSGNFVIQPDFELIRSFENGLACALPKKSQQWGLINRAGALVIPPKFDWCDGFLKGFAPVKVGDKWGFINTAGKTVVEPKFDQVQSFDEGIAAVRLDGKWGYINTVGETVIPHKFDEVRNFDEGVAPVRVGSKWGFINSKGDFVIAPRYFDASSFVMGLVAVDTGDKWVYIDHVGNIVQVLRFKEIDPRKIYPLSSTYVLRLTEETNGATRKCEVLPRRLFESGVVEPGDERFDLSLDGPSALSRTEFQHILTQVTSDCSVGKLKYRSDFGFASGGGAKTFFLDEYEGGFVDVVVTADDRILAATILPFRAVSGKITQPLRCYASSCAIGIDGTRYLVSRDIGRVKSSGTVNVRVAGPESD